MAEQPNPLRVAFSILRAQRTAIPRPSGTGRVDHTLLGEVLKDVGNGGVGTLPTHRAALVAYRDHLETTAPNGLARDEALAYWINLYNAGALALAAEAQAEGRDTVLRVPGGFSRAWARIGGEDLSLDDIEHGKIRRFRCSTAGRVNGVCCGRSVRRLARSGRDNSVTHRTSRRAAEIQQNH